MFQWQTFLQTITTALFVAITGGLWAMYIRVLGHGERIAQLQQDVAEQKGVHNGYDARLRSVETMLAGIDANVKRILETQSRETRRMSERE